MAVHDLRDDGRPETVTDLRTGHDCPACGSPVLNGQGLYTCFECDWVLADSDSAGARRFDHPVFHR